MTEKKVLSSTKLSCVFRYQDNHVMKMLSRKAAEHELQVTSTLRCVDPTGDYTVYPLPKLYYPKAIEIAPRCEHHIGLVMPYGGVELMPSLVSDVFDTFLRVVYCLSRIKTAGILHLDLRLPNILVDDSKSGRRIRIIDFGESIGTNYKENINRWIGELFPPMLVENHYPPWFMIFLYKTSEMDEPETVRRLIENIYKEYSPELEIYNDKYIRGTDTDLIHKWLGMSTDDLWSQVVEPNLFKIDLYMFTNFLTNRVGTDIVSEDKKAILDACMNPDPSKQLSVDDVLKSAKSVTGAQLQHNFDVLHHILHDFDSALSVSDNATMLKEIGVMRQSLDVMQGLIRPLVITEAPLE